ARGGLSAYQWWILKRLSSRANGTAYVSEVYDFVWNSMRYQFTEREKRCTRDGRGLVWKSETRDAREGLINARLMKESRIRGLGETSYRGRSCLRNHPVPPRLAVVGFGEDGATKACEGCLRSFWIVCCFAFYRLIFRPGYCSPALPSRRAAVVAC